jgi:drug/metabolite transporter (DMT)-like permease
LRKKETRAILCLLLTSLIWGFAFSAQKEAVRFMGNFTFGGARFLLGALSLLPVVLLFERKSGGRKRMRKTLLYGTVGGTVLFFASALQQFGIDMTSAGKAGFITALYIILVPVFGVALKRRPPRTTWVAALLAFSGLFFLSLPRESGILEGFGGFGLGDGLLLIGAAFWAVHILVVDRLAARVTPLRFSMVQFAVCGLLGSAAAVLFEEPRFSGIAAGWQPLFYCAFLSVGAAYTLQSIGQRHVTPARAAILFSLEALFGALGGILFLREVMGWKGWLGGGLMFAGILLAQVTPQTPRKTRKCA